MAWYKCKDSKVTMKPNSFKAAQVLANAYIVLCTFLNWSGNEALVEILPSQDVQHICAGEQLNLTCATNESFLDWVITVPFNRSVNRRVTAFAHIETIQTINVSARIMFHVQRSPPFNDSLPLVSMLASDSGSTDLNGTTVTCSGISTSIYIIGNSSAIQNAPNVGITEQFLVKHVSVTLEWTRERWPVVYDVNVKPPLNITYIESTTVQLAVPYNTVHNVSVTATLCGYGHGKTSNTYELSYGKCSHPLQQQSNTCVQAINFVNPATMGMNVTLRCSASREGDLEQTLNITTCMNNGKWSPDPSEFIQSCTANCSIPNVTGSDVSFFYDSVAEGSSVIVWCQKGVLSRKALTATCHCDGNWIPDPRSYDCSTLFSDTEVGRSVSAGLEIIISSILGPTAFFILILSVAAACAMIMKRKGSMHILKQKVEPGEHINNYCEGECSLLYHSSQEPEQDCRLDNSKAVESAASLVYADLGPSSFKKRQCVTVLDPDENRVEYAQVTMHYNEHPFSLKSQTKVNETNPPVNASELDEILNLDSLLIQVRPSVADKWYQFGEALGINSELLNKCTQYSSEQSLIEILDNWLRNYVTTQPNWRDIAHALDEIGLHQLALDINCAYITGKLPVEVCMDAKIPLSSHSKSESPPPIPPRLTENLVPPS